MEVKRQAAERWCRAVNADGRLGGWCYLLARNPDSDVQQALTLAVDAVAAWPRLSRRSGPPGEQPFVGRLDLHPAHPNGARLVGGQDEQALGSVGMLGRRARQ